MKLSPTLMRTIQALSMAAPLLALFSWAYVDGTPYRYLPVAELLSNNYGGAAESLPDSALVLGLLPLVGIAAILFVLLSWRSRSAGEAAFAGAAAGLVLVYPGFVGAILEGQWTLSTVGMLLGGAVILAGLHMFLGRLRACAAPAAGLLLLLGISWSGSTANDVALRSNPPLAILAAFAESPQNVDNRLRMGLHLWSLGGAAEARPYLMEAAGDLEKRYADSGATALAAAARMLALRAAALPAPVADTGISSPNSTEE